MKRGRTWPVEDAWRPGAICALLPTGPIRQGAPRCAGPGALRQWLTVDGGQVVPAMIAHGHLLWWLQQGERACVPDSEGWGASRPGIDRTPVLGCCAVQVHVSRMSFAPLTGTATALKRVRVSPT